MRSILLGIYNSFCTLCPESLIYNFYLIPLTLHHNFVQYHGVDACIRHTIRTGNVNYASFISPNNRKNVFVYSVDSNTVTGSRDDQRTQENFTNQRPPFFLRVSPNCSLTTFKLAWFSSKVDVAPSTTYPKLNSYRLRCTHQFSPLRSPHPQLSFPQFS